jgi:hypothetical protein
MEKTASAALLCFAVNASDEKKKKKKKKNRERKSNRMKYRQPAL